MQPDEYQEEAKRTLNFGLNPDEQIFNILLGMIGEAGEILESCIAAPNSAKMVLATDIMIRVAAIADAYKKHRYQGHDLDLAKLRKELGDILWYVTLRLG